LTLGLGILCLWKLLLKPIRNFNETGWINVDSKIYIKHSRNSLRKIIVASLWFLAHLS
jgi:hypothetical protein